MSVHTPVRNPAPSLRSGSFLFTVSLVYFCALLQESVGLINVTYKVCVHPRRPLHDFCMEMAIVHENQERTKWFLFSTECVDIEEEKCFDYTKEGYSLRNSPITDISTCLYGSQYEDKSLTPAYVGIFYNEVVYKCYFQREYVLKHLVFDTPCKSKFTLSSAVLTRASLTSMLGAILQVLQCL